MARWAGVVQDGDVVRRDVGIELIQFRIQRGTDHVAVKSPVVVGHPSAPCVELDTHIGLGVHGALDVIQGVGPPRVIGAERKNLARPQFGHKMKHLDLVLEHVRVAGEEPVILFRVRVLGKVEDP